MCGVMPFGGWVLNQMNYKLNIKIVNSSKIGGGGKWPGKRSVTEMLLHLKIGMQILKIG